MENEHLDSIIFDSVAKTIESIAFTEVLPADTEMASTEKEYGASLSVSEPCAGMIHMIIGDELLCGLAEDVFGITREELKEEALVDFLFELLNTIAGSILNSVLPGDIKFSLGIPERANSDKIAEAKTISRWNFKVMESLIVITVSEELREYFKQIQTA